MLGSDLGTCRSDSGYESMESVKKFRSPNLIITPCSSTLFRLPLPGLQSELLDACAFLKIVHSMPSQPHRCNLPPPDGCTLRRTQLPGSWYRLFVHPPALSVIDDGVALIGGAR
ncbi:hypothetical protein E1B28_002866 [Marasmius oreades]|uniref:Uncharacterized protein n=1 Tax=Marasmius oreades TaxID=181124 RepID=A0A9P7RNR3_9AGAR|nr:uncharacterized protein E1B28_002866 [Marasmius oreades]KAG7086949.1 hypothetical protein E1B28_002866 [Marasmius oreades]